MHYFTECYYIKTFIYNIFYFFQYPEKLEINQVFLDLSDWVSEAFVGRVRINLTKERRSHPSRRNFLALFQGLTGKSYKESYVRRYEHEYIGGISDALVLPPKEDERETEEWTPEKWTPVEWTPIEGSVFQSNIEDDDFYSYFTIILSKNSSTTKPKLGEILKEDLHFLRNNKNEDLTIYDCGVIID